MENVDHLIDLVLARLDPAHQDELLSCLASKRAEKGLANLYHNLTLSESASTEGTNLCEAIPLAEALSDLSEKGTAEVVVLCPGFNKDSSRFYPKEVLARDFRMFEGAQMYRDHKDPSRYGRSVDDLAGVLTDLRLDEQGRVHAKANVVDESFKTKLRSLRDKGLLSALGVSHFSKGDGAFRNIEGKRTFCVDKITRVDSVDFVSVAGAGGAVQIYESMDGSGERMSEEETMAKVTMEMLMKHRPDLVQKIKAKEGNMSDEKMNESVAQQLAESATAAANKEALTALKANDAEILKRLAEADKRALHAEVTVLLSESGLPEPSRIRIKELFADASDLDIVRKAVEAEKTYVATLTESATAKKKTNLGPNASDKKDEKDVDLAESFSALYGDPELAKRMAAMR